MVLPIIMKTESILTKRKCKNVPNFITFKELTQKSGFLKIAAQAFKDADFLNILKFLRLIFL